MSPSTVALAVLVMLLTLAPQAAACPYCAGQNNGGIGRIIVIGMMVAVPFVVVWTVIRVLKRAGTLPHPMPLPTGGERS